MYVNFDFLCYHIEPFSSNYDKSKLSYFYCHNCEIITEKFSLISYKNHFEFSSPIHISMSLFHNYELFSNTGFHNSLVHRENSKWSEWLKRVHTWLRSWSVSRCSSRGLKQFWHLLLLKMFAWNFLHVFSFALDIVFLCLCASQNPNSDKKTVIIPMLFHPILDTQIMISSFFYTSISPVFAD